MLRGPHSPLPDAVFCLWPLQLVWTKWLRKIKRSVIELIFSGLTMVWMALLMFHPSKNIWALETRYHSEFLEQSELTANSGINFFNMNFLYDSALHYGFIFTHSTFIITHCHSFNLILKSLSVKSDSRKSLQSERLFSVQKFSDLKFFSLSLMASAASPAVRGLADMSFYVNTKLTRKRVCMSYGKALYCRQIKCRTLLHKFDYMSLSQK